VKNKSNPGGGLPSGSAEKAPVSGPKIDDKKRQGIGMGGIRSTAVFFPTPKGPMRDNKNTEESLLPYRLHYYLIRFRAKFQISNVFVSGDLLSN
jgi:hypothetical protein